MVGITGTKGKTSIAYLLESILTVAGEKVGALGTVNYRIAGRKVCDAPNTTPAALPLFSLLNQMKKEDCRSVVMEVSSHSLEQQRVRHIWYDTAVFTNLQRDHLDYHLTFENYFLAKQKLFENLADAQNPKQKRVAVINADDPYGRRLLEQLKGRVETVSFSLENPSDLKASNIREHLTHTEFTVNGISAKINLLGRHNVYNALAAIAVGHVLGIEPQKAVEGFANYKNAPLRQNVYEKN